MFLIELPKAKAGPVMETFNNDYDLISDNLDIQKNRLVLLNPNRKKKKKSKSFKTTNND